MENTRIDSALASRGPAGPLDDLRALGEYRLLRRLGEGGMGDVYLGFSERLGGHVAVKILADALSSSRDYVDRFYREAKSLALLNHPNIVRTLTVGQDKATGKHYLTLEYVEGFSAHALLEREGKLEVGDAVHIALDVARALEHAHSRNVVHRDIKPDNILLSRSGVAKLVDFGLAKRTDEASHLTATRQGFGTTPYMPYEQAINAKYADGRSDIYALGATLYHLLTGVLPFPGENHVDVVERKNVGTFTRASLLRPEVPPELDRILEAMMARDPRDRYQTASELIVDLERAGLAATVPSFADPERAREDPLMQSYIASTAEPTRLDPNAPPRRNLTPSAVRVDGNWLVRVRAKDGAWRKYKATTRQIIQRLRDGKMPNSVEASKADGPFLPLSHFNEFQDLTPTPKSGKHLRLLAKAERSSHLPRIVQAGATPSMPSPFLWIGLAATTVVLVAGALLLYVLAR
jgi:serine/threonine-protein kinase